MVFGVGVPCLLSNSFVTLYSKENRNKPFLNEAFTTFVLFFLKYGHSLKIKILHIHLYFIATQFLCNYALIEDIDN